MKADNEGSLSGWRRASGPDTFTKKKKESR